MFRIHRWSANKYAANVSEIVPGKKRPRPAAKLRDLRYELSRYLALPAVSGISPSRLCGVHLIAFVPLLKHILSSNNLSQPAVKS